MNYEDIEDRVSKRNQDFHLTLKQLDDSACSIREMASAAKVLGLDRLSLKLRLEAIRLQDIQEALRDNDKKERDAQWEEMREQHGKVLSSLADSLPDSPQDQE